MLSLRKLKYEMFFHYLPRPVTLTIHVSHRQHEELQVTIWNWKSFQHSSLLHLSPLPILVMALIDEQLDFILTKHVSYNASKFLVLGVFFFNFKVISDWKGWFLKDTTVFNLKWILLTHCLKVFSLEMYWLEVLTEKYRMMWG